MNSLHHLHRPLGDTGLRVSPWGSAPSSWAATRA